MSDRELLELAAKAAGVDFDGNTFIKRDRYSSNIWDPLFDDGDAMRLAVELDIDVFQSTAHKEAQAGGAIPSTIFEPWGDDKFAATRRAIVRAAAEIGRVML